MSDRRGLRGRLRPNPGMLASPLLGARDARRRRLRRRLRRRKANRARAAAPAPTHAPAGGPAESDLGAGKTPLESGKLKRVEQKLSALIRAAYIDVELLPYPDRLLAQRFHMYSQNEEDGLVVALLKEAGIANHTFVEIGCGENGGNSGFIAGELNFRGIMVDGGDYRTREATRKFNSLRVNVLTEFVTRENINALVSDNGLAGELDVFSVDIDGVDYWIWDGLTAASPRIVICEYNSLFGPDAAVTIPYKADFNRADKVPRTVYGTSLSALVALGRRKGYRLVVVEPRGSNAFFLRNDLATHIPELPVADAFRMLNKNQSIIDDGHDVFATARKHGIELVEVGR